MVLEPIFEADFLTCSSGFRPKRSATQAMEKLPTGFIEGKALVFEADIKNFFGSIDHERLMPLVAERVSDRRVLKLLRQRLSAGVLEAGVRTETVTGTPQGGVIGREEPGSYLLSRARLACWIRGLWSESREGGQQEPAAPAPREMSRVQPAIVRSAVRPRGR
jgi:hypothetical protein